MHKFLYPLLESAGSGGGGGSAVDDDEGELEQDLRELEASDEDTEPGEKKEKKKDESYIGDVEEDAEEPEDDEEEIRAKGEEGDEEEEEETTEEQPDRDENGRPTVKAIKTKYPELFKEFPELKRAFFMLPRFEEVFADPQQAVEAAEKSREFDELESDLVQKGSASLLVKTLAENNPKALKKLLSNFAQTVKTDFDDGYLELANPILEELVYMAFKHGEKTGNKNLVLSARHIANFVWSNAGEIPDVSKRQPAAPTEAERELARERSKNAQKDFNNAVGSIMPMAEAGLRAVINQDLRALTSFERKSVIRDTFREVDAKISGDKAFQLSIGRLWERAKSEDYSDAAKERVKNAWLSRARQLAIPIRNRLRKEALDARSSVGRAKDQGEEQQKRTFPSHGGRDVSSKRRAVLDPSKIDWRKTSDMDILNSK